MSPLRTTTVVAEMSGNHQQSYEVAEKTVRAAAEAGADAVKLQTFDLNSITLDSDRATFIVSSGTIWDGRSLYDLYREVHTPWEWFKRLKPLAEELGLMIFSTPGDSKAVDFLVQNDNPVFKIASFEITDIPLIRYTASKGKPIIISTGIADAGDIQLAVDTCRGVGNNDITLLQCTSSYPAPVELANLRMIPNLAETFGVKSGLSDHTPGSAVAVGAVALGATMVEKHFILDRNLGGPDASFSTEPAEFKHMVDEIRTLEKALGEVDYSLSEKKRESRKLARSLFVVEDVPAGAELTAHNIRSIRPEDGLHPKHLPQALGRRAARDLKRGEPLAWGMISP